MFHTLFFFKENSPIRLAVVTSKRIGKSVARNRVRRRIKEIIRYCYGKIEPGLNLIVVAKPAAARAGFESMKQEFLNLARKGKFVQDEKGCAVDD